MSASPDFSMAKRPSETPANETAAKVPKLGPFQTKGKNDDEVTLRFDDGNALYVPTAFLKEVSPVFKVMLESEFEEGKTGEIKLRTKSFDHFLDFLQLLHPEEYKPVTEENVIHIMSLADEYQIPMAKEACKVVIHKTMNAIVQAGFKEDTSIIRREEDTRTSTRIIICGSSNRQEQTKEQHAFSTLCTYLQYLSMYSYEDELNRAILILSKFPFSLYIQNVEHGDDFDTADTSIVLGRSSNNEVDRLSCAESFAALSNDLKGQILYKRLTSKATMSRDRVINVD